MKNDSKNYEENFVMDDEFADVVTTQDLDQAADYDEECDEVLNGTHMFLKEIGETKLLSFEEELELGRTIQAGGPDWLSARNKLVEANLKLVVYFAKRYRGRGLDLDELISIGTEGLIRAAEKYDPSKERKFSTYASFWITQSLTRGLNNEGSSVRIPTHLGETITRIRREQKEYLQRFGTEPTVEELAAICGWSEMKVQYALAVMNPVVSLDAKVGENGDTALEDFVKDDKAADPCEMIANKERDEIISAILQQLEPREALILSLRYGLGVSHPMTLEEIANYPGIDLSRERVRQLKLRAINKIRRNRKMMLLIQDYAA